ncbi:unnamed protein product [Macrosiphum euphorbiae]|uniref:Uncharacterized protein n=1 Tax=Macrosiphum euphorbiae TaxID=13131 RepID=A0AAV0XSF9_9HEMI|nr:unnamed protein product [Macrosiphum euphorbiae]
MNKRGRRKPGRWAPRGHCSAKRVKPDGEAGWTGDRLRGAKSNGCHRSTRPPRRRSPADRKTEMGRVRNSMHSIPRCGKAVPQKGNRNYRG